MNDSRPSLAKQASGSGTARRGVLLLVVLSMLTLFMMLGVAYVIMASRARESSRAFSRALSQERLADRGDHQLLGRTLLLLLRGIDPSPPPPLAPLVPPTDLANTTSGDLFEFESLLRDMYGSAFVLGRTVPDPVTKVDFSSLGPVFRVTIGELSPPVASPIELTGRIISFKRETGRVTSHRILRAESVANGTYSVVVANFADQLRWLRPRNGTAEGYDFPPSGTDVVINGRAHSGLPVDGNEPWDGYDFNDGTHPTNPFLAQIEPDPSKPLGAVVSRLSMFDGTGLLTPGGPNVDVNSDGIPDYCDNDGDGVLDGQFFDPGFEPIPIENGVELRAEISCLIVDLDGRLNLNAHGTLASVLYPPGHSGWPSPGGPNDPLAQLPPGSGYGPAEINAQLAFDELIAARMDTRLANPLKDRPMDDPLLSLMNGGRTNRQYAMLRSGSTPDPSCRTLPPSVGPLEGRYGELAREWVINSTAEYTMADYVVTFRASPGENGIDDNFAEQESFLELSGLPISRPLDLHGRLKHRIMPAGAGAPKAVVPTMEFFKPENSSALEDLEDDPYELDLVTAMAGGRNANPQTNGESYSASARDNRFSLTELERVLRPYDPDAYRLPQRLFGLLGSQAEAARLLVTTESWTIPAITGDVANQLFGPAGWFSNAGYPSPDPAILFSTAPSIQNPATPDCIPDGLVPGDVAAGLRLDVAPVLHTDLQRRTFFKDLYMLCVALSTPPDGNPSNHAEIAQWAANVVEYQDSDSRMTLYEYDFEPEDGWDVDGDPATPDSGATRAVVWGGERPDVIITQALAWENSTSNRGGLHVVLHRPLKSTITKPGDDPAVPPPAAEPIDPNLRGVQPDQLDLGLLAQGQDPVWRLRIGSGVGAKTLRFDDEAQNLSGDPTTLGSKKVGSTKPERAFGPHEWLCISPDVDSEVSASSNLDQFKVDIGTLRADPGVPTVDVRLERLADPTKREQPDDSRPDYNPYLVVDAARVKVVDTYDLNSPAVPRPIEKATRVGWTAIRADLPGVARSEASVTMTDDWHGSPEWFPWPDRPLIGITELLLVPGFAPHTYQPLPNAFGLFDGYQPPVALSYLPDPQLLEAVRVPSRFTGTRLSVPLSPPPDKADQIADGLAAFGVSTALRPANQIDLGREPGRVNLNTISNDATWKAVVQGAVLRNQAEANVGVVPGIPGRVPDPDQSNGQPPPVPADFMASPAKNVADLLALQANTTPAAPYEDSTTDVADADRNPWHRLGTATRLSNVATNRSHVFGIWITVRTIEYVQSQPDPGTVKHSRMFVIYDRSIPVAFEPGKDHNVADGILLKRVLP